MARMLLIRSRVSVRQLDKIQHNEDHNFCMGPLHRENISMLSIYMESRVT